MSNPTYQAFHFNLTNPKSKSNIISSNNFISQCYYDPNDASNSSLGSSGGGGGVYYIGNNLTIRDSDSTYEYNSAYRGAIY